MLARYADKLPTWLAAHPFEVLVSLISISNGVGFLLAYHAGTRPLLGELAPLAANGLGALSIVTGFILMRGVCHRDPLMIVHTLYSTILLTAINLVVMSWNGITTAELAPPFLQGLCVIVVGVLRASHLRSVLLAARRITKE